MSFYRENIEATNSDIRLNACVERVLNAKANRGSIYFFWSSLLIICLEKWTMWIPAQLLFFFFSSFEQNHTKGIRNVYGNFSFNENLFFLLLLKEYINE